MSRRVSEWATALIGVFVVVVTLVTAFVIVVGMVLLLFFAIGVG